MQKRKNYNIILQTPIIIIMAFIASYLILNTKNTHFQLIGIILFLATLISQTLIFQNIYNRDFQIIEIIEDKISQIPSLINNNNNKLIDYIDNKTADIIDYTNDKNTDIAEYIVTTITDVLKQKKSK